MQGFTISRRCGVSDTLSIFSCNRADPYYFRRDEQLCPYFLAVSKVGELFKITHSDLRHNHVLDGSTDPNSIRPIPSKIISVLDSLGFRPSVSVRGRKGQPPTVEAVPIIQADGDTIMFISAKLSSVRDAMKALNAVSQTSN